MSSSKIWDRQVDPALSQRDASSLDTIGRQFIDSQTRGAQQHLVQSLIGGTHCTWATLDASSADGVAGDVVCLGATATGTVTRAVAAALTNAGSVHGVLMAAATHGTPALVALGGIVPTNITGLVATSNRFARVNTTTARIESVAALSPGDFSVGTVDAAGNVSLRPGTGGSGASGGTTTVGSFTEPTLGATTTVNVADATVLAKFQFTTIAGTLNYLVTNIVGNVVTIYNGDPLNATGSVIAPGATVAFGGAGAQVTNTAIAVGQSQVLNDAGKLAPYGQTTVINVLSFAPPGTLRDGTVDWAGYFQAAVNACIADGRTWTIYVPRGIYALSTTVYIENSFVEIQGAMSGPYGNGGTYFIPFPPAGNSFPAFMTGYRVNAGPTVTTRAGISYALLPHTGGLSSQGIWYTDSDIGNCDQLGDFTRQMFLRFSADALGGLIPIDWCGGGRFSSTSGYTRTWALQLINNGTPGQSFLRLDIVCNDGYHTISSGFIAPATNYHVAITRSTSTGKFTFWINGLEQTAGRGGTQGAGVTSPLHQTTDQLWQMTVAVAGWPTPGNPFSQVGGTDVEIASDQMVTACLYTVDFTPPTTEHTITSGTTKWLINYPAVAPLRPEIVTILSSNGHARDPAGDTVLHRWHGTRGAAYTNRNNFRDVSFVSFVQPAIRFCTTLYSKVERVASTNCPIGISFEDFSYKNVVRDCEVYANDAFDPRSYAISADHGSQYLVVENFTGGGGHYTILAGAGGEFRSLWCTNATNAAIYGTGAPIVMQGVYCIDDGGNYGEAVAVFADVTTVDIQGGYLWAANTEGVSALILDRVNRVRVGGILATKTTYPPISFASQCDTRIEIDAYQGNAAWTDFVNPRAPNAFRLHTHERNSVGSGTGTPHKWPTTITVVADADITLTMNQMGACSDFVMTIADPSVLLTATRKLIMPAMIPGMECDISNTTAHDFTVISSAPSWVTATWYGAWALITDVAGTHVFQRQEFQFGSPPISGAVEPTWVTTTPGTSTTDDGTTKNYQNALGIRWLYLGAAVATRLYGTTVTIAAGTRRRVSCLATGWV